MASLKEGAQGYEPSKTKNIAELEAVSVEQEFFLNEKRKNSKDEEYLMSYIVVGGEEYRVPNSVLEQLKVILEAKPDLKTFKVTKKGELLKTSYTVIQLE